LIVLWILRVARADDLPGERAPLRGGLGDSHL